MKMTKLTYLLTIAVAALLVTTGCNNHKTVGVTKIKGSQTGQIGEAEGSGTLPGQSGVIPLPNIEEINNMAADRAALASSTVHFAYDSSAIRKTERSKIQAVADRLSQDRSASIPASATIWPPAMMRFTFSAGRHFASPFLIT